MISPKDTATKDFIIFEETIKKSLFISSLAKVSSEEEAKDFIEGIRKEHKDATHNCFAYRLKSGIVRFSDDGEPKGTAGKPILNILEKNDVVNCAIVVTRYFGGTLLGTGGLIRAYSNGAKSAFEKADMQELIFGKVVELKFNYKYSRQVESFLKDSPIDILSSEFKEEISYTLFIKEGVDIKEKLIDLTKGTAIYKIIQSGAQNPRF